jgi:hypothetical protein
MPFQFGEQKQKINRGLVLINYDDIAKKIELYLFNAMKDIKIYTLKDKNMILDIDYSEIVSGIIKILKEGSNGSSKNSN